MKINLLKNLVFIFAVLLYGTIQAQTTVSGTVSDAMGPLPGANILVKGTTNGTQSDFDGNFILENVAEDAVLVFSYVGFKTQEVVVNGQATINVMMAEDAQALDEVVIVGYGQTTKKDATGAVDAVSSEDFTAVNAASPAQLMRGKVAGVQVTQASGEPGGAARIRVRGGTSIRSGNEPLIVIDGIPLSGGNNSAGGEDLGFGTSSAKNPLNFINQNDIESINILKDASSTAIYGSRGANGVILITTKKGKAGVPRLEYSTTLGVNKITNDLDMMNSSQYAEQVTAQGSENLDHGSRGYDWTDALTRSAVTQSHNLSMSFSSENSRTRLSLGLLDQEGVIKRTGFDKYSAALNNTLDLFDNRVKLETSMMFTQIEDQSQLITDNAGFIGNLIGMGLYWNPTYPIRNDDGSYFEVGDDYLNPVQILNGYKDKTGTTKFIASISPTVKITDELSYKFVFGADYSTSNRANQLLPSIPVQDISGTTTGGAPGGGFASTTNIVRFNKTFENILTFDKDISDNFKLKALLGFSYYKYDYTFKYAQAEKFNVNQTNLIDNMEGGSTSELELRSSRNSTELQSYFARIETVIFQDLLINASFRTDGSNKVGADNTYDYFPAVGVAYKFIDNFEEGKVLNFLKLRLNYGITGNQEFDPNAALAKLRYNNQGNLDAVNTANNQLKWETTTNYGVGLDFSLIDRKLSGSVDYFFKETEDLIFPLPAEAVVPNAPVTKFVNLPGKLQNSGVEVGLNYTAVETEDFSLSFSGNAAFLDNEMKSFGDLVINTGGINGQGLTGAYAAVIMNNKPIHSYFMNEWLGFDEDGNSIYTDLNGEPTGLGNATKKLLDKSPNPKINVGFNINMNYKAFDFSTALYGAYGHHIYNNTANALFFKGSMLGNRNVPLDYATTNQNQGDPNSPSTRYLESGDFLRLANVTLGYTLNNDKLGSTLGEYISSIRLYASGTNLFTITPYSGFDPEVDTNKTLNGVPSAGMDYLTYPNSRGFTLGLNVTF